MKRSALPVTFYAPNSLSHSNIDNIDPDVDWAIFKTGCSIWIIQTYLRLKRVGCDVYISPRPPSSGFVILHADHLHEYLHSPDLSPECIIVCVRADRSPQYYADIEITQNGSASTDRRCRFIPHWPQPNLVPRNISRGEEIKNISFKGSENEIHPYFKSSDWLSFLAVNNLCWVTNTITWKGSGDASPLEVPWNDYSDVDLFVAIRPNPSDTYKNKPATKLVNAWLAGVPALLGSEYAYRELRRSDLDYVEVSKPEDIKQSIIFIKNNPHIYAEMIRNGKARGQEFNVQKITDGWLKFVVVELNEFKNSFQGALAHRLPLAVRMRTRWLAQQFKRFGH